MRISDWSSDVCSSDLAAIELVIADHGRVDMVYQTMSEANLRQVLALPFTSVGSDAEAMAPEGAFLRDRPHPRAYGAFARVLGHYVREAKLLTLPEAGRRKIGRASCRERVCRYVSISVGAVYVKKKH